MDGELDELGKKLEDPNIGVKGWGDLSGSVKNLGNRCLTIIRGVRKKLYHDYFENGLRQFDNYRDQLCILNPGLNEEGLDGVKEVLPDLADEIKMVIRERDIEKDGPVSEFDPMCDSFSIHSIEVEARRELPQSGDQEVTFPLLSLGASDRYACWCGRWRRGFWRANP